ncbi:ATP-binding protein [Desulfuromonas thiophila]|uniref:AAA domain-containing protein n=1 Tax=Desulfuromonas thiophila TaxID=57664 RepID=A0A1G7D065_9BACT|nr:AAA family ATPase [Desulfuromonas thiophila]SDE44430.1 AAA domain-containing protein [Desulfuromonas thiophila]
MMLRQLELKDFGCFSERSLEFRRGLNLVHGANEAGKSTLLAAIGAILFGLRDSQRYRSWGRPQATPWGRLCFEHDDGHLRVERDFGRDTVVLAYCDRLYQEIDRFQAHLPYGACTRSGQQYRQQLRERFGLADEQLFRAAFSLDQGALAVSNQALADQLRLLFAGLTQCDSQLVLRALQEDYAALTGMAETGRPPRALAVVTEALERLRARQRHNQAVSAQLAQLHGRMAEVQQCLQQDRAELRDGQNYLAWLQHRWQTAEPAETAGSCLEPSEEVALTASGAGPAQPEPVADDEQAQLEQQLRDAGLPVDLPPRLVELLTTSDELRQQLVQLQLRLQPARQQLLRLRLPRWRPTALCSLLFIVVGGGVAWCWPGSAGVALAPSAGTVGLLWLLYGRRRLALLRQRNQLQQQLEPLELQRDELQARLQEMDTDFEALGLSAAPVERVRLQKQLHRCAALYQRLAELRDGAPAIAPLGDEGVAEALDRPDTISAAAVAAMPAAPKTAVSHLTPADLPAAQQALQQHADRIARYEAEWLGLLREEALCRDQLDAPLAVAVELDQLERERADLEHQIAVLGATLQLTQQAMADFRQQHVQRCEQAIGSYVRLATRGAYRAVRIDDADGLTLSNRSGRWLRLDQLSRATADIVVLAIRLALGREVSHGVCLPFLFDDALINLDEQRLDRMMDALERLAQDHQLILFSHDTRLLKRAVRRSWHLLDLDSRRRGVAQNRERKDGHEQLSLL